MTDAHHHGHAHEQAHRHAHGHAHGHGHGADMAQAGGQGRAFAIGVALNAAFVVAEVFGGVTAHSVALLADAAHNLGDVLGLGLAWGGAVLARRPPSARRTYGWGRGSILAALVNAAVLLASVGAIAVEALRRLLTPEPVATVPVMAIAAAGIVINGVTALLFVSGRKQDLNIRAAFLHMASDAGLSAGVVAAALLIRLTGWLWIDPAASLGIAVAIAIGSWGLLRDSVNLAVDAVPPGVSREDVHDYLVGLPGVTEVHDLHIWGLSTAETALTAHLVCAGTGAPLSLHEVAAALRRRFGIGHATVQIESDADAAACGLRPHDVI